VRIAHRIRDLQALPYVVVMQEGVSKVYEVRYIVHDQPIDITPLFTGSCTGPRLRSMLSLHLWRNLTLNTTCFRFRRFPRIETLEDNERFCVFLRGLLDEQWVYIQHPSIIAHAFAVPSLSQIYLLVFRWLLPISPRTSSTHS